MFSLPLRAGCAKLKSARSAVYKGVLQTLSLIWDFLFPSRRGASALFHFAASSIHTGRKHESEVRGVKREGQVATRMDPVSLSSSFGRVNGWNSSVEKSLRDYPLPIYIYIYVYIVYICTTDRRIFSTVYDFLRDFVSRAERMFGKLLIKPRRTLAKAIF